MCISVDADLKGTVMIVEDDEDIREAVAEVLRDEGYSVLTASEGREALAKLRENGHSCVILLDLMMPGMDGWQFRGEQLRDRELADVPVVVVSGVADLEDDEGQLKPAAVLRKPFRVDRLIDAVEHLCIPRRPAGEQPSIPS